MKKILNKIRNIFIGIGVSLMMFGTKVFGKEDEYVENTIFQPAYGTVRTGPGIMEIVYGIMQLLLIPVIFIIGLVCLIKKQDKKEDKIKKIIIFIVVCISLFIILGLVRVGFVNYYNNKYY